MYQELLDPPKSPLKRGTLILVPPLIRGVWGDQQVPNDEKKYPNIRNYAQTSTPDLFIFRNMQ